MKISVFEITPTKWRCSWREGGKQRTKHFKTEKAARSWAKTEEGERNSPVGVTHDDRLRFGEMRRIVTARGLDSDRAWEVALAAVRSMPGGESPTMFEAARRYGDECLLRKMREASRTVSGQLVARLIIGKESRMISTLTREELVAEVTRSRNEETRKGVRSKLAAFVNWCAAEGWVNPDVAKKITWKKTFSDEKAVTVFSVDQAGAAMVAAPDDFKAFLALALFAGIRPDGEMSRLTWAGVDFAAATIEVTGEEAKGRRRRVLHDLPENLWAWLSCTPPEGRKGRIFAGSKKTRMARLAVVKKAIKLRLWPKDVTRHSFASAAFHAKGAEWTVETMGHVAGFDLFAGKYKGIMSKADAEKYFAITPASIAVK